MENILFTPIKVGSLQLRNRLVMAPMGTNFGKGDGKVTQMHINHYAERAKNGIGTIIVEAMYIHPSGAHRKWAIGMTNDDFIPGLRMLTDEIHKYGSAAVAQLNHTGRINAFCKEGAHNIGPSAVPHRVTGVIPHALSIAEIEDMVKCYGDGAARAKAAGFDAVEVHAGHSYLIQQFVSRLWNKRVDEYGGCLDNRIRFALEIVAEIRRRVGESFPIGFRIDYDEMIPGGQSPEESIYLAKKLEEAGVDVLHVSGGSNETPEDMRKLIGTMYLEPGYFVEAAAAIKKAVKIPVIAVGRLGADPALAAGVLESGKADMITLGRALYADPLWAKKVQEGRGEEIVKCVACNQGCIERLKIMEVITCMQNPLLGRDIYEIPKAKVRKKILVVGAGVAGMEAARVAARRGHDVTVWEASGRVSGQVLQASLSPGKDVFREIIYSRENDLKRLGVPIILNRRASVEDVLSGNYDEVIVAEGSTPASLNTQWINAPIVKNTLQFLEDNQPVEGMPAAIMLGGGSIGLEGGHQLAELGYKVYVMELYEEVGGATVPTVRAALFEELEKSGVQIITAASLCEIDGNDVYYIQNGRKKCLHNVVAVCPAVGVRPTTALADELTKVGVRFHSVGACTGKGMALECITDACTLSLTL